MTKEKPQQTKKKECVPKHYNGIVALGHARELESGDTIEINLKNPKSTLGTSSPSSGISFKCTGRIN